MFYRTYNFDGSAEENLDTFYRFVKELKDIASEAASRKETSKVEKPEVTKKEVKAPAAASCKPFQTCKEGEKVVFTPMFATSYEEYEGDAKGIRVVTMIVPGLSREDISVRGVIDNGEKTLKVTNKTEDKLTKPFAFSWVIPTGYEYGSCSLADGVLTIRYVKASPESEEEYTID